MGADRSEYSREYTEKNRERLNAYQREYWSRPENRARRREQVRAWHAKNKEVYQARWKKYYEENRAYQTERQRLKRIKLRDEIFSVLGSVCAKCGFADIRALQIDHVNGGGGKARRLKASSKYYSSIIAEVRAGSKEYQILCANCNWIKRLENSEL